MSARGHPTAWCLMRRRTPSTGNGTVDLITPDELAPNPYEFVHGNGAAPDSIAGWKALADSLLTNPVLRIPPQPRDLLALRLDLQAPPRLLEVGRHGRVRVAPCPTRALSAAAGHRSDWLRRHSAQPGRPESAAHTGRQHDPRDEQRHLRRHLLGAPRVRHHRRRHRPSTRAPGSGAPLRSRPLRLRGDRARTPYPGGRGSFRGEPTDGQRSHLGRQRPAPRARATRAGATQPRSPLVRVRPAVLHRLGSDL